MTRLSCLLLLSFQLIENVSGCSTVQCVATGLWRSGKNVTVDSRTIATTPAVTRPTARSSETASALPASTRSFSSKFCSFSCCFITEWKSRLNIEVLERTLKYLGAYTKMAYQIKICR